MTHRYLSWRIGPLLAAWLGITSGRANASNGGFSEPKEIEKRLNAARAELAALPPDADPDLSDALQHIVASGEYHLSSIGALAAMRDQLAQAKTDSSAEILGKWAFGIGLSVLVLHGLNAVRIPLTAFAFLGGALAIGVGFGTQTILKNFISGIILHFERPLKVGDVVEVSTITGTIRRIGMRASVIQHFDGIETLVPNSILLENQLTNWTFSSTIIRHSVTVGGVYGSPTREVSRVLLAVAASLGLVMKDPPPEVRFDNFGTDSLHFTLLFWLDSRKIARNQLASDLRFMIDGAFAEAGIVVAFPQRDIHFNSGKPLRVELSRPTGIPPV